MAVADADQARRASGAWLASRSKPPEPAVAAFMAMDAMPDLASAPRADLHHWVQAKPFASSQITFSSPRLHSNTISSSPQLPRCHAGHALPGKVPVC